MFPSKNGSQGIQGRFQPGSFALELLGRHREGTANGDGGAFHRFMNALQGSDVIWIHTGTGYWSAEIKACPIVTASFLQR
jgi:hypothetical protein